MSKKGILKKVGLMSLGIITCVGVATCVTHAKKIDEGNSLIVTTNNSSDSILKINQRKNIIDNGNNSITLEAELVSNTVAELEWTSLLSGSMGQDDGKRFISMEVSDNTMSCTITLIDLFDSSIIVRASVKDRPTVSASCTLDCYKRFEFYGASIELFGDDNAAWRNGDKSYGYNYSATYNDTQSGGEYINLEAYTSSKGTVDADVNIKYHLRLSEAFIEKLNDNNVSVKNANFEINNGDSLLQALNQMIDADPSAYYGYFKYVECPLEIHFTVETKLPGGSMVIHTSTGMFEIENINFDDYYTQSLSLNYENYIF